ncbi:MAG: hypothetical protein L0958_05655 [Candidatus Mariimomonas ferrooxydans]
MVALTCKEILNELKKLGVNNVSERKNCYREYVVYYVLQHLNENPVQEEVKQKNISAVPAKYNKS